MTRVLKRFGLTRARHATAVESDELNHLVIENPYSKVYGVTRDAIASAATSYPGTPDTKLRVDQLMPTWCYIQIWAKTSAGTGSIRFEWQTSVGGVVDICELTVTSTTGQGVVGKANMTTLGGINLTGAFGWINIYLKTTSGTVTLMGASAYSASSNVDADQWSP